VSGLPDPWGAPRAGAPSGQPNPQPPRSLQAAIWLMYASAALGVLSLVLLLGMGDQLKEAVAEDNPSLTESQIDSAVAIGMTVGALFGGVGIGLQIWLALMNGQGKSWARTVTTVLGVVGLVFAPLNLVLPGRVVNGVTITLALVGMAITGTVLILLYQRDSSEYYRTMSAPRWGAYGPGARPPGY
jgi:hypothetical protein